MNMILENRKSSSGIVSVSGRNGFPAGENSKFIKRFKNKMHGLSGGRMSNVSNINIMQNNNTQMNKTQTLPMQGTYMSGNRSMTLV